MAVLLRLSLGRAKVGALGTGLPLSLLKLLQVVQAQLVQRVTGTNNHLGDNREIMIEIATQHFFVVTLTLLLLLLL